MICSHNILILRLSGTRTSTVKSIQAQHFPTAAKKCGGDVPSVVMTGKLRRMLVSPKAQDARFALVVLLNPEKAYLIFFPIYGSTGIGIITAVLIQITLNLVVELLLLGNVQTVVLLAHYPFEILFV